MPEYYEFKFRIAVDKFDGPNGAAALARVARSGHQVSGLKGIVNNILSTEDQGEVDPPKVVKD